MPIFERYDSNFVIFYLGERLQGALEANTAGTQNQDKSRLGGTDDDILGRLPAFRNDSKAEEYVNTRSQTANPTVRQTRGKADQSISSLNSADREMKASVGGEMVSDDKMKDVVIENFNNTKGSENTRNKDATADNSQTR